MICMLVLVPATWLILQRILILGTIWIAPLMLMLRAIRRLILLFKIQETRVQYPKIIICLDLHLEKDLSKNGNRAQYSVAFLEERIWVVYTLFLLLELLNISVKFIIILTLILLLDQWYLEILTLDLI